jgi:autotransporter-associated beta strand protein
MSNPLEVVAGASVILANGSTTTGTFTWSGAITLNAGSTFNVNADTSVAFTVSGAITGTGAIVKGSANSATLSGNNVNYTGTVTPSAGTLAIGASSTALVNALLQPSTGALSWSAGAVIGGLTGSTAFSLGTTNLSIGSSVRGTETYSGALGGTSAVLTKVGTNTQVFNGPGTRTTGTTNINGGVIRLTNSNGLYGASGSGRTTVATGNVAAHELVGGISTPTTAPLTLQGTGILSGGGLRSISGTNTYGGAILLGSSASITADAGSFTVRAITIAGNALTVAPALGASITLGGIASSSTANGAVTIGGLGTVFGGVSNFLSLSAATNGTTVSGALDAAGFNASLGALSGEGTVSTSSGASTLTIGGNGNSTFSGAISGAIALTKTGTGTQTLSGTNTPTGATSVGAGTLSITGSLGASSAVAVTGTLQGTGSVGGAVTVATGGTVGAGLGAGSGDLSLGSTLTYSGTGFIAPSAQALGANLSKIAVTGALSLSGNVTVNATAPSWVGGTYTFAEYASESGAGSFVAGTLTGASGRQSMTNVVTGPTAATFDVATGNLAVTWAGGVSGDWYSGGTGWTGSGGVNDFLNNDPATFSVSGAATPTATLTGNVSVASLTMSGAAYTVGASGAFTLTNAGALAISGAFRQTLNVAGEHAAVSIGAGATLELGNINALGSNTNPITLTGSAAKLAFGSGANGLSTARTITLSPGGAVTSFLETSGGAIATISGAVTGGQSTAALTKIGSGTVSLTGTNSYASFLRVGVNTPETAASNVLRVTPTALPNTNLRLNAGSVLEINGGSSPYTFSRTYGTGATAFYTENLVAGTGGGFSSFGTGGLTVSANITFGTTATSQWVGPMYLGTAAGTANSATTLSGAIVVPATNARFHVFNGSGGAGSASSTATISGVVSGIGGLEKSGPGTLRLTNNNTYEFATDIRDGVVETTNLTFSGFASSLGVYGAVFFGLNPGDTTPAATLRYTGPTASTNLSIFPVDYCTLDASGTGRIVISGNLGLTENPVVLTLTGSNSGDNALSQIQFLNNGQTSSLDKTGAGTWLIDSTFFSVWGNRTGATTISSGKLKTKTASTSTLSPLGTGAVTLSGTLQSWNTTSGAASIQVSSLTTSGGSARIILGA